MTDNKNPSTAWLQLDDAVCVVTGAAGGIGRAIARGLIEQKTRLVLLDRDQAGCAQFADALSAEFDREVLALGCDIAEPDSVRAAAATMESRFGTCDVLINNASVLRPGALEEISLEHWNQLLAVNLSGYLLCAQAFGRGMLARRTGRLVHIASIAAQFPQTWSGAYSAAKGAVCLLSRQLAAEWGPRGIRSNVICPGMIRTPLSAAFYADPAVEAARTAMTANRRIGEPQDIANAALFLASPRADYINGAELTVDGGFGSMLMDLVPRPGFQSPLAKA
ncbi:SDR family NAD(P)-dependent oxidoreductase [Pseudomonas panipatensis]|uniref:SDR family NAD(P)-dependent oxidoreductase n=1 Tax=Pseudomonas panipatensis TaxID=428992 RepID=UPI0035B3EA8F